MTTKEIPEIRQGSQNEDEVKGNSAAANTLGESGTQGTVSKLKDPNVQDKKEAKLKKNHHHRHHHSGHRHNHHKHQGKNHPEGRHGSDNHSHKRHHSHHGLNHPHRFHGIKSRGGSHGKPHHRHHRHHHDSSHAQVVAGTSTLHGSRVKREEPMKMNETKEPDMNNKKSGETGASGESKSLEGNEMDDHGESSSISSESNEAGRSNMDPLDVLDVAPGPYLQQNSEEDDSEEMGRVEVAVGEPELKNWNEYVANQRSSLLANPNKKVSYILCRRHTFYGINKSRCQFRSFSCLNFLDTLQTPRIRSYHATRGPFQADGPAVQRKER
ncbi:unnamed protein product [Orchesella dallaii]|uniref:Uncharacterized protein n=1 Tax=Orchesella dallaii TaxID=48710 RepID=A0ABP1QA56_9HEXA